MEKKSGGFGGFWIVLVLVLLLGSCSNTSSSRDSYRDTLERGQQKYYSGQKMTKEEYNAVKSFNKWKANQGEKSYSDWDN